MFTLGITFEGQVESILQDGDAVRFKRLYKDLPGVMHRKTNEHLAMAQAMDDASHPERDGLKEIIRYLKKIVKLRRSLA